MPAWVPPSCPSSVHRGPEAQIKGGTHPKPEESRARIQSPCFQARTPPTGWLVPLRLWSSGHLFS